jgi:hypothetical protein
MLQPCASYQTLILRVANLNVSSVRNYFLKPKYIHHLKSITVPYDRSVL